MTDFQRFKKVVDRLIELRLIFNQRDLAEELDYTSSTISQIINGKVPISKRMVSNIQKKFPMVNGNWILTGKGNMENTSPEISRSEKYSIAKKATDVSIDNETINRLVDMNMELAKSNNILAETAKDAVKASQDAISMASKAIDNNQEKMDRLFTLLENSLLKQPAAGAEGAAGMVAQG